MSKKLAVRLGQFADKGVKAEQQDFHGAGLPEGYVLTQKGIVCAIADGISSSNVSHVASETAVSSFIQDYYSTPDSWSVKTSAERVIRSINSWLYSQTQQSQGRFDKDRGYVCTFSSLVLKHNQAHLFHIGDARIYRIQNGVMEQLTTDHRISLSSQQSYLSRALGVEAKVEIDYVKVQVYPEDIFLLMTDGAYEHLNQNIILKKIEETEDLNQTAQQLIAHALEHGSQDNLSIQILKVDDVSLDLATLEPNTSELKIIPELSLGDVLDGFSIEKVLYQSHRSRLYLAIDQLTQNKVVLKTLSTELQQQPAAIERFILEEWVAKRIDNRYVMHAYDQQRPKTYLYQTFEFLEGQSLGQWLNQREAKLELDEVVNIIEQLAKGLNAFHRLEMLHQDIRPENVMINANGKLKLIDFGSVAVKSLSELKQNNTVEGLGTLAYMAPEYFIGLSATERSDQYSLAVLAYYLLSGQLPYGTDVAKCTAKKQLKQVTYQALDTYRPDVPYWFEGTLKKALNLDHNQRFHTLSEFVYELKHPNHSYKKKQTKSQLDQDPVGFWRNLSFLLIALIIGYFLWLYI